MSVAPIPQSWKDTLLTLAYYATTATSLSSLGITTKRVMANSVSLEDAFAQCAAYRHAIKDVVREEDPVKLKEALARLLSDDSIGMLGRDFHFIIKHAVQMVHYAEQGLEKQTRETTTAMFNKVKELSQHATVKGWLKD